MSSQSKNDKTNTKQKPLRVFRRGAIAASIWRRQTPTGFEYLDFSLSRSWKLKSGEKEGYSNNFFDRNAEALTDVIDDACQFIRSQQPVASEASESEHVEGAEVDLA